MNGYNPDEILDPNRFIQYEKTSMKSDRYKQVLKLIDKNGLKVCDVGGASGVFLNKVIQNSEYTFEAYILDIDKHYKDKLVNKKIKFINQSILNNKIKDNYFDVVTFRHVLHHLVYNDIKTTKLNQEKALSEVFRITKKGGYIVFEEEVNNINLFSKIIYSLSKRANKYKIKSNFFQSGKVIVYFMSQEEIIEIIKEYQKGFNLKILKKNYVNWDNMGLRWKLTLLMSSVGHVFYVIKRV